MAAKNVLAAVDAALAAVVKTRAEAAAVLADAKSSVDALSNAKTQLSEARNVLAGEEQALVGIERALIVAADDDGIVACETMLKNIVTNQRRVVVMIEEIDVRLSQAQQAVERAGLKRVAAARRAELTDLAAKLDGARDAIARLDAALAADERAHVILNYLAEMAAAHPDVSEFNVSPPASLGAATQGLADLALKYPH